TPNTPQAWPRFGVVELASMRAPVSHGALLVLALGAGPPSVGGRGGVERCLRLADRPVRFREDDDRGGGRRRAAPTTRAGGARRSRGWWVSSRRPTPSSSSPPTSPAGRPETGSGRRWRGSWRSSSTAAR